MGDYHGTVSLIKRCAIRALRAPYPVVPVLVLFSLLLPASAKTTRHHNAAGQQSAAARFFAHGPGADAVRNFESALTPYLQARISHLVRGELPAGMYLPSQADYRDLAKYWSFYSEEFKTLYAKAVQIPAGLKTYNSPGGHYQIIYTTSGKDSVDVTDTMGYSPAEWRVRLHGGNGVPDYVDWVAFAADSAWSMEIDRFGFDTAYPYTGNGYSPSRTKIFITASLGSYDYGQTFPDGPMSSGIGFRSHIEIQNNWSSFAGSGFDYYIHPEKAIRVTCVHENFHTIQYAMTRQLVDQYIPEDFPASWIEGSAVLMEDLGFNYVHDYFQYLPDYFDDPLQPVLDPTVDNTVYKNGIVAIYLYQFAADTPCICFVKDMLFNDYHSPVAFADNLRSSAAQNGRVWADLLGSFHTGSYYTGSRAVAGRFIRDAPLIADQWSYGADGAAGGQPLTKAVRPFAMNTFSFVRQSGDADVLRIEFTGDSLNKGETDTNAVWSVRCIAKKDNVPADDSVFVVPVFSVRRGLGKIDGWHNFREALVIVTNARYGMTRNATVTFEACSVSVRKGDTAHYYAVANAPAMGARNAGVTVLAKADLSCDLSITKTAIGTQLYDGAAELRINPIGTFYAVFFPGSWQNDATMNLAVSIPKDSLHSGPDRPTGPDTSLSVYRWDSTAAQWVRCPTTASILSDSTRVFQCALASSGIFGLFEPLASSNNIVAYPNPARLKSNKAITFVGKDISEVWVYTVDGVLLAHASQSRVDPSMARTAANIAGKDTAVFSWKLQSNGGKPVSPGVYYAYIKYADVLTKAVKRKAQKIFVVP